MHVPADQLPAALGMAPREWEAAYRSAKPGPEDWVVMACRTNKRAAWAAQVAQDSGWQRVLVYRQATAPLLPPWSIAAVALLQTLGWCDQQT